eukprot:1140334-Pelagomonas_calceolata.AAC.4
MALSSRHSHHLCPALKMVTSNVPNIVGFMGFTLVTYKVYKDKDIGNLQPESLADHYQCAQHWTRPPAMCPASGIGCVLDYVITYVPTSAPIACSPTC